MPPRLLLPRSARTPGWVETEEIPLFDTGKTATIIQHTDNHRERAEGVMVNMGDGKNTLIVGGGQWTEDQKEMAVKIVERNKKEAEERRSRAEAKKKEWIERLALYLEQRTMMHRKNFRTDPAPNHTRKLKGYF